MERPSAPAICDCQARNSRRQVTLPFQYMAVNGTSEVSGQSLHCTSPEAAGALRILESLRQAVLSRGIEKGSLRDKAFWLLLMTLVSRGWHYS